MINDKSVLAIIPARGGSKGVPRKNIKPISGKPLIAWTIEEAKKSKYIDRLVLSSEDDEIISVAKEWGCDVPFKRPIELAGDDTPGMEPILHAIDNLPKYDYIVLLQVTTPLRNIDDIDQCIELCFEKSANAVVTFTEPDKSPYWMYTVNEENRMSPLINTGKLITQRQDLPTAYALNGAVYVANVEWLQNSKNFLTDETIGYVMPKERSFDIDTKLDFEICEYLLEKKRNKSNV